MKTKLENRCRVDRSLVGLPGFAVVLAIFFWSFIVSAIAQGAAGAPGGAEDQDALQESGETVNETGVEDEADDDSVSEPDDDSANEEGTAQEEQPDSAVKTVHAPDHADTRGALTKPVAAHEAGDRAKTAHMPGVSRFRINDPESWFQFRAALELGFIGFPKHVIQFGKAGDTFDFLDDGGQDNLFLFWRVGARFVLFEKHNIKFLYQPLDLTTNTKLRRDVQIDTVTFAEGTPLQSRYGFDFYRATYLYRFLNTSGFQLSAGGGMQIRNARITFTSADGLQRFDTGNIGPVPLISIEARYNVSDRFWLETEIDGFYAWIKYINGGNDPIVGAILDASLRAGFNVNDFMETFLNLRYLGGGARGTNEKSSIPSDGYTNNWIHAITLSVGLGIK